MIEIDIPQKTVDTLLAHVYSKVSTDVFGTFPFYIKVTPDLLDAAFGDFLKVDNITTGYIYAHDEPIPLHVDRYKKDAQYNLCVPIKTDDSNQKLLIFDQTFDRCGCEWQVKGVVQKRHKPATDEDKTNSNSDNDHAESICYSGVRPFQTDGVENLTTAPVNIEVIKYLPFDPDFYFGLSGKVWDWRPGKGLIFKSSQLHTTGYQFSFKVGCVLLMKSADCLLYQ